MGGLANGVNLPIEVENQIKLISFIITSIVLLLGFILKGVAIHTMAKRLGLKKLYFAYIPFLNFVLLGKIVGPCIIWRKRIKNLGLIVAILSFVTYLIGFLLNLGYYASELSSYYNFTIEYSTAFARSWMSGTGVLYVLTYYLYQFISLVEVFLLASLLYAVFRDYYPQRAFIFMIIAIFFDFMLGFLLFFVRNYNRVSYNNYIFTRMNNNPYNNQNYYTNSTEKDPFPEFSDNKNGEDNSSSGNDKFEDDLFN